MKKNIFLWALYDFANSIVTIVFFLYFSQWLVIDQGVSDFWFNMIFAASTLLLLVTVPAFAILADRYHREMTYLNRITVLTFLSYVAASISALFFPQYIWIAVVAYLFAQYFYQFSFVFYNALLDQIAPPSQTSFVSGLGQSANWLGEVLGIFLLLPFATGVIVLFGDPGRAQTFLPATLMFFILALPMMLFFKAKEVSPQTEDHTFGYVAAMKIQWQHFKALLKAPGIKHFLLAYFFFNDAILTASNNFAIYLEQVFSLSDEIKSYFIGGIMVTAVIGAFVSGWVTLKIGLRKALFIVLGSFGITLPLLAVVHSFPIFVLLCICIGFLFGAIWTVTRAAMLSLCPKEKLNFGFSFYTLFERFSSFLGPISWGLITLLLNFLGPLRYRVAMFSMAFFIVVGILLLRKIPSSYYHQTDIFSELKSFP